MATKTHELMKSLATFLCVWCMFVAVVDNVVVGTRTSAVSSDSKRRQEQERNSPSSDVYNNNQPNSRYKSTFSGLLQTGHASKQLKLLRSAAQVIPQQPPQQQQPQQQQQQQTTSESSLMNQNFADAEYKCANYCSCSVIQVVDKASEKRANLTQVRCESSLFTDLLTIDRQTHIIHISLPINKDDESNSDSTPSTAAADEEDNRKGLHQFRMPRLNQFNLLKEIVIINLRFEVCDSEVFKRGQKMRRIQLNYNRLGRISKACLKHLDKLIELNLDYNNLSELESALFNNLVNLKSLSIAYNQLNELAAHQFANLSQLVSLNLVGNSFKSINLQLFEPMQNSLRLLLLAKNQIKSFVQAASPTVVPMPPILLINTTTTGLQSPRLLTNGSSRTIGSLSSIGVIFKKLIKLNVDENKFERIKLLQLHRFYNVKYLSIRQNNIATIRDKAFNGLKLIELNLAHNQLQTVSKCAFCNATIKRLVLSHNNISFPLPTAEALAPLAAAAAAATPIVPRPMALNGSDLPAELRLPPPPPLLPEPQAQQSLVVDSQTATGGVLSPASQAVSSPNLLILSQSIFGPLFSQLEYLDLSNNQQLSDQLEILLEPLLKLEYLNLAAVGLDRYLPSPVLFKNLRQLRYLNLSHNQLDQLLAETVEPLSMLEVLDLSHNKFSEIEESFLVVVDEMASLKVINLGSNPWYCSQCKVAPLYDWILRSPLYNTTCIAPSLEAKLEGGASSGGDAPSDDLDGPLDPGGGQLDVPQPPPPVVEDTKVESGRQFARGPQHYSLLVGGDDDRAKSLDTMQDIDLILASTLDETDAIAGGHYNLLNGDGMAAGNGQSWSPSGGFRELASNEDDPSIALTMLQVSGAPQRHYLAEEYCLKCEFPSELRSFQIHELQASDFKFCAGAAPRFAASEPKIGLTLAIVIIGALFCIIIIVIIMYRKKSNTYYTNEDMDQLENGGANGQLGAGAGKKPVFSISSDVDHQYGDNTDYSSPPMSQSLESYSQDDENRDEDLDEEEEEEDEEEDEEFDEDEELDEEEEGDDDDDDDNVDRQAGNEDQAQDASARHSLEHNEKNRHRSGPEHHVGYAADLDTSTHHHHHHHQHQHQQVKESSEEQAALAKRMAAAEAERRHQLAEYHKKEQATALSQSQRTSHSQGSSLSPADRSASGPLPQLHQRSASSREPAKRQSSAHHHHQQHHHSSRSRPAAAVAVAATGKLAAAWPDKDTPTAAPPLAPLAVNAGAGSVVGAGETLTTTGRNMRGTAHAASIAKAMSAKSGQVSRSTSSSEQVQARRAVQSVETSLDELEAAAAAAVAAQRLPEHHQPEPKATPETKREASIKLDNKASGGSRQASLEAQLRQSSHQPDQHHQHPKRGRTMRTPQTSDLAPKQLRHQSSAGSQHQPATPAGSASKPPIVEPPTEDLSREAAPMVSTRNQVASVTGISRLASRQRLITTNKEQKSQPAMEWAHLRPTVEPPTAPHSLVNLESSMVSSGSRLASNGLVFHSAPTAAHHHRGAADAPGKLEPTTRSRESHHHHHEQQQQHRPLVSPAERRQSPLAVAMSDDATTADSLNLEALSYTASEPEEPLNVEANEPEEEEVEELVGGALEVQDSSGSFGPDEFMNNNNNNNIINESSNNHQHRNFHLHNRSNNSRLQAAGAFRMRQSHSNHSALTQASDREEL